MNHKEDIYTALGYPPMGRYIGAIVWAGTPPLQAMRNAIDALPDDEAAYLVLNLSTHAVSTELSPANYAIVKAHQVAAIVAKRREDYVKPGGPNDDFINQIFDLIEAGTPLNKTSLKPWIDKVKGVKIARPFSTP